MEKPLASNLQEVEAAIKTARKIMWSSSKRSKPPACQTSCCLNSRSTRSASWQAFINYCQYSSRYQRYLDGENPAISIRPSLTARSWTSAFTAWPPAVALWGEPSAVHATASLLESGVDGQGTVVLSYGDFDVTYITEGKRFGHTERNSGAKPARW